MTKDTANNLALTCDCGSVNFALLKSGSIECNKCSAKLDGAKWFSGGLGAQIRRAIKAEDERDVLLKQLEAQPALSDEDFYRIIRPFYVTDEVCKMALPLSIDEFRAIEAHLKGQK